VLLIALLKDVMRPHFLFLGALLFLLVTGVLEPTNAFSGFANEAVFTVAALFVVAAGVQQTGAFSFMDKSIFNENYSPKKVAAKMMGITAILSAFLNNTPIVAMLIPRVQSWADKKGISPSKLLIPLSYATIVGGTATLIGTSTNIIVSGMMNQQGMGAIGMFELSFIGVPAAILTFIWFMTFGLRFLPNDRKQELGNQIQQSTESFQFDYKVPSDAAIVDKTIEGAGLRALEKAFLIHIQRKDHIIGAAAPDVLIQEGDVLTFNGTYEAVHPIATNKGLIPAIPRMDHNPASLPLYEAVVSHSSPLVDKTLKEIMFREKFHAVVLAIHRKEEKIQGAIGNTPIKAGDLLLIEAKEGFEQRYGNNNFHFYLVRKKGNQLPQYNGKGKIALLIIGIMLLLVSFGILPMVTAALLAAVAMILSKCLQKEKVLAAAQLPILVVIATAIGIGKAVEISGLAQLMADSIFGNLTLTQPVLLILLIYIITNVFTELITNNAAAVLMFPIAIALAAQAGIPLHAAGITVAVAASASFLTPIGYQTNLMVMSAGGYKFTDYTRAGFPVTLILMTVTVGMIWWRYL
jgi:di/tricarboxylate transporter